MSLSLLPLLIHHEAVPAIARTALRATCGAASADERRAHLETAARALCREAHLDLDCADARELVGLTP